MPNRKKWEIPHLDSVRKFETAARAILAFRLRDALELASRFKSSSDAEDLHQLRIALRRLRYPLETLVSRFKRKTVLRFIEEVNSLQDAAGGARDLDVLLARLKSDDADRHWMLRKIVFLDLEDDRLRAYSAALDAIDLFLVGPALYDFKVAIDYERHIFKDSSGETGVEGVNTLKLRRVMDEGFMAAIPGSPDDSRTPSTDQQTPDEDTSTEASFEMQQSAPRMAVASEIPETEIRIAAQSTNGGETSAAEQSESDGGTDAAEHRTYSDSD